MNKTSLKLNEKIIVLAFVTFFALLGYRSCFIVTNEIGSLGMDKYGRQVMIQTFDYYLSGNSEISSEWDDYTLIKRLWQEPMRTTFRINVQMSKEDEYELSIAEGLGQHNFKKNIYEGLNAPFEELLQGYTEDIALQENLSIPIDEFKQNCRDKNITTVKDLLAGLGFKRYQLFLNGEDKFTINLPSKNIYHSEFAGWQ